MHSILTLPSSCSGLDCEKFHAQSSDEALAPPFRRLPRRRPAARDCPSAFKQPALYAKTVLLMSEEGADADDVEVIK